MAEQVPAGDFNKQATVLSRHHKVSGGAPLEPDNFIWLSLVRALLRHYIRDTPCDAYIVGQESNYVAVVDISFKASDFLEIFNNYSSSPNGL